MANEENQAQDTNAAEDEKQSQAPAEAEAPIASELEAQTAETATSEAPEKAAGEETVNEEQTLSEASAETDEDSPGSPVVKRAPSPQKAASSDTAGAPREQRRGGRGGRRETGRRGREDSRGREESEWEEKIIQVRRVTKVVKGGKKLSFRSVVVVGNGKGQVGVGIGKAAEVIGAIQKGIADAKKNLINVPLVGSTLPHQIVGKQGASHIIIKPAAKGTGIIAGGAARAILELAGVGDVLAKSLGSRSPLNVARATINGLKELRTFEEAARLRGISLRQMLTG